MPQHVYAHLWPIRVKANRDAIKATYNPTDTNIQSAIISLLELQRAIGELP